MLPSLVQVSSRKLLFCLAILQLALALKADQLPARAYTTADGLPVNRMNDILADRLGFLWFASEEGLTRFDGYKFQTFTIADGLPAKSITALLQDRDGSYWLGTAKGLCHFNGTTFKLYPFPSRNEVNVLFQDRRGRIWCGAMDGLFLLKNGAQLQRVAISPEPGADAQISAITEDQTGVIWASFLGCLWKLKDGQPPVRFSARNLMASHETIGRISSLLTDAKGRVWVGTWSGLCLLKPNPVPASAVAAFWTPKDGLSSGIIHALFRTSDGLLWALSEHGLTSWEESSAQPLFRVRRDAQRWLNGSNEIAAEDHQGALWISTETHGVIRVLLNGLTTFGTAEGLLSEKIRDLFEDNRGRLLAVTRIDSPDLALNQRYPSQILYPLSENELRPINPRYPPGLRKPGWGERQIVVQDHLGEWWISTAEGLFRFPAVPLEQLPNTRPTHHYTRRDLGSDDIFALHEDRHGDIWVSTMGGGGISRWQRSSQQFQRITPDFGAASVFQDDPAGNLWLGWWGHAGLARFHHGHLETFSNAQGLAPGSVTAITQEPSGRLWITTAGGLSRIDHPAAEHPKIQTYPNLNSFAHVPRCLTQDQNGILYIGTNNGLVIFNPATGQHRHLGMKDGLPAEEILSAFCARNGILWFGTHGGLVRFQPPRRPPQSSVPLRIVALQMGGKPWPVAKLGETSLTGLRLNPGENVLQIEYADLSLGGAGQILFQSLLIGSGLAGSGASWSPPTENRALQFAGLTPGNYTLSIRAVDVLGNPVSNPVTASFRVMPQFWQTWWFQLLCAALFAAIVTVIYRYRVSRLIAVQKLRSRIAFDLHDEVGAGLTQIAIWSELARQNGRHNSDAHLEQIAVSSRALVDTIGDIIWTVNPQRDSVRELVQRVRYFATEICTACDIRLDFEVNSDGLDRQANSEIRRDVFLIAKEAIHNAVRHAACTVIHVCFRILPESLELEITDNGRGFAASTAQGNGLASMRQRAAALGASIHWTTPEGGGTRVTLKTTRVASALGSIRGIA